MPLAEAQSLLSRGHYQEHAPRADREALRQLAWECQQFTPRAGMDDTEEPDCLFLDISGCEHLFGDTQGLCTAIAHHFHHRRGYVVRGACAPTWGAAFSLAQHSAQSDEFEITFAGELRTRLSAVPVEALRLPVKILSMLAECGLRQIGQLLEQPRSSLPSRFGPQLLLRLDQTLGIVEEIITPEIPPQPCVVQQRLEFPIREVAAIDLVIQQLLEQVVADLQRRQVLTQEIRVTWTTDAGETPAVQVRLLKPTSSTDKLWDLLSLRRERLFFTGGVTSIEIEALPCRSDLLRRTTLFEQDDTHEAEFTNLIERLSQRLGPETVLRYRLLPEAQPELAQIGEPWVSEEQDAWPPRRSTRVRSTDRRGHSPETAPSSSAQPLSSAFPLRLLGKPERVVGGPLDSSHLDFFRWRGQEYRVTHSSGPERIVTGWWRERSVQRDYYRIETDTGIRFWVFRDIGSLQWSVHGLFE